MFLNLRNTRYMQYACAIIAGFSSVGEAVHAFWTSPALRTLQSEASQLGRPITDDEGSWVASLHKLGILPAAFVGGWLIERFGRKYTLLTGGILLTIPWFMIMFAKSIVLLHIARFIAGLGSGIQIISCAIYIGEIVENDIRGKLALCFTIFRLSGSLLVLCVGPYVSYVTLAVISAAVTLVFVGSCIFIPESPYYLAKVNRSDDAEKNLKLLSGKSADKKFIEERLEEIDNCIKEDMQNKTTIWEFLSNPDYRKAIFIMIGVKTLHQFSGVVAIDSYMQTIVSLTTSNIPEEVSSIIFGFVQLPAALVTSILVDKLGRKPLWVISATGCAVALFAEGTFFYLQDKLEADVSSISWLPTVGIALFLMMNPLGIVPLPYVLLGEIFPTNIKGIAGGAVILYSASLAFLVAKFFKPIANAAGMYTVFFSFASVCVVGVIFILIVLPETKGKSFAEIQAILKKNKGKNNVNKDII